MTISACSEQSAFTRAVAEECLVFALAGQLPSSTLTTTNYTYNPAGDRLTATQGSTTLATRTWNGADQLTAYTDSAAQMS